MYILFPGFTLVMLTEVISVFHFSISFQDKRLPVMSRLSEVTNLMFNVIFTVLKVTVFCMLYYRTLDHQAAINVP